MISRAPLVIRAALVIVVSMKIIFVIGTAVHIFQDLQIEFRFLIAEVLNDRLNAQLVYIGIEGVILIRLAHLVLPALIHHCSAPLVLSVHAQQRCRLLRYFGASTRIL